MNRGLPDRDDVTTATILFVDDEEVTRLMVQRVLGEAGHRVLVAEDGAAGVAACRDARPDLVLLDVRMPRMNGFEVCRAIRAQPPTAQIPVLMLTGLDDVVAAQLAFEAGATDFITKPINWTLLGERVRYALRTRDIELRLRASEQRLVHAQQLASVSQWAYHTKRDELQLSQQLGDLLGSIAENGRCTAAALLERIVEEDRYRLLRLVRSAGREGGRRGTEIRFQASPDSMRYLFVWVDVVDEPGHVLTGIAQDITERREAQARLSYYAHFDVATGLPNSVLFRDRASHALADARHNRQRIAVLQIAFDQYRDLDASLGHVVATRALCEFSARLLAALGATGDLSRLDGGQFMAVLGAVREDHEVASTLQRIRRACEEPMAIDGGETRVTTTTGVALYPEDGEDVDTLLLHAGSACAGARDLGTGSYQFFTPDLQHRAADRLRLEMALQRAHERGEFVLHFQPRLDLRTRRVTSVEALVRWQNPDLGLQFPGGFIPVLETTGLIVEVGHWVLRQACEEIRDLPFGVSVNLSPRQFQQPNLARRVQDLLREIDFPASRLELEVTERAVMRDEANVQQVLTELRTAGIGVAMDDYGVGYSSLLHLKNLPLDTLKIDRDFVRTLNIVAVDATIVRSTIELCHQLGLGVVAEGAEDIATVDTLAGLCCDAVQGYAIARPMPADELHRWLAEALTGTGDQG